MSKEGPDSEVVMAVGTKQAKEDSISKAPKKGDKVIPITKESYLKFLGQLLREHYNSIKETGFASDESQQFLNGYLTAARTLHAVYQKELNDFAEKIHFEIFNMTIHERKKSLRDKPDLNQADPSEEELDIPTYKRKGIRLKF